MNDASRPDEFCAELVRHTHAARLRLDPAVRWLISAHLVVFALALEDEEIVEMMAEAWNLSSRMASVAEALISLLLLAAWGALTLGWVRIACRLHR